MTKKDKANQEIASGMPETATPESGPDRSAEYLELLQRTQADFANYRKRVEAERAGIGAFANQDLILRLLPILDNFKLATKHLPDALREDEWARGIAAIERQFDKTLEDEGLTAIDSVGHDFDPSLHEAISFTDGEDGKIVGEISAGYKLGDKVIRAAKVVVAKKEDK